MTKKVENPDKSYAEVLEELQTVLDWFQSADVSVDQAAEKYQAGLQLIATLETRLASAEAEIQKIANA